MVEQRQNEASKEYVFAFWVDEARPQDGRPCISLEDMSTGKLHHFTSLDTLIAFLQGQMLQVKAGWGLAPASD